MFKQGKLYAIKRLQGESDKPFIAGDIRTHYSAIGGHDNFHLIPVPNNSILLFLGVETHNLPMGPCESYSFLFEDKVIIFKKDEVDKGKHFLEVQIGQA
jgi:hypothetical protein